jgi:hypothetical protein
MNPTAPPAQDLRGADQETGRDPWVSYVRVYRTAPQPITTKLPRPEPLAEKSSDDTTPPTTSTSSSSSAQRPTRGRRLQMIHLASRPLMAPPPPSRTTTRQRFHVVLRCLSVLLGSLAITLSLSEAAAAWFKGDTGIFVGIALGFVSAATWIAADS